MRKPACFVFLLLLFPLVVTAQITPDKPLRPVKGRVLTSAEMPAVKLKFAKDFKYAGGHKFILYNVAHAEQHFL
jgi:hypothetical protein